MADPAVDKALSEIGDRLADLPNRLGPKLAKYETEINALIEQFNRLQNTSGHLSQNELPALLNTLKKFSDPYIGDNLLKILASLTSAAAKGEKEQQKAKKGEVPESSADVLKGGILIAGLDSINKGLADFKAALSDAALKTAAAIIAPLTAFAGSVLGAVGATLSYVASVLTATISSLLESTVVQSVVIPTLIALATSIGVALIPVVIVLGIALAAIAAALALVTAALAVLAAALFVAAAVIAAPFVAAAALLTGSITALAAPFVLIGSAALAAVGPFLALGAAANAITTPFQILGNAIGPFVSALNPSLMEAFNYALKTLQATIGVAFVPVIQVFTVALRQVAGALLPLMQQMAPILGRLAGTLVSVLIPVVQTIVELFVALMPVIELAVDLFRTLAESFKVLVIAIRTLVEAVAALFGGDFKGVADGFKNAIRSFTLELIKIVALLAKFFGAVDFIDRLIGNLGEKGKPGAGVTPAATDASIKSIEAISKDIAQAAFTAQGGGGVEDKSEKEYLDSMVKELEQIRDGGGTIQDYLNKLNELLNVKFESLSEKIATGVAAGLARAKQAAITDGIDALGEAARPFLNNLPKWLGGFSDTKTGGFSPFG